MARNVCIAGANMEEIGQISTNAAFNCCPFKFSSTAQLSNYLMESVIPLNLLLKCHMVVDA